VNRPGGRRVHAVRAAADLPAATEEPSEGPTSNTMAQAMAKTRLARIARGGTVVCLRACSEMGFGAWLVILVIGWLLIIWGRKASRRSRSARQVDQELQSSVTRSEPIESPRRGDGTKEEVEEESRSHREESSLHQPAACWRTAPSRGAVVVGTRGGDRRGERGQKPERASTGVVGLRQRELHRERPPNWNRTPR